MFLRNKGASGRFTFDVIFSCLQKSMRRGDLDLATEMVKEFKDYPNALKKRLVYDCCEDCPNLYLIRDIYNTKPEIGNLYPFVQIICQHVKCREVIMGFRVACQDKIEANDFMMDDDMYSWCRKVYSRLCSTDGDTKELIEYFINKYPILNEMKLKQIWNFINKNRLALYVAIAFFKVGYITDKDYMKKCKIDGREINFEFNEELVLPDYVYDKHVKCSPKENKGYEFFIKNIVLIPRMPKTELELKGEELYITTNMASGDFISKDKLKGIKLKKLDTSQSINVSTNDLTNDLTNVYTSLNELTLLQTQLITARHKPRTWFCKWNSDEYNKVLKGPMNEEDINELILSDKLKQKLGLVSVHSQRVILDDDEYLLMDNLITIDDSEFVMKTSKLETNVKIFNGDAHFLSDKLIETYPPDIQLEILKNLIFRKIIGTNDTCSRNIIVNLETGVVASIDDPVLLHETPFVFKKQITNKHISNYYYSLTNKFNVELEEFIITIIETMNECEDVEDVVKNFIIEQANDFEWQF